MPDLIKNGHLYIIDAPLFVATGAKTKVYGMTRKEIDIKMKEQKCSDYTVTRLKRMGRMFTRATIRTLFESKYKKTNSIEVDRCD